VWNPNDWKNIKSLKMPYKILWVPDIFLFDAADSISWNIWQTERNLYNRIQKKWALSPLYEHFF
jgi:hypothetical protein